MLSIPTDLGFQFFTGHLFLLLFRKENTLLYLLNGFVGQLVIPGQLVNDCHVLDLLHVAQLGDRQLTAHSSDDLDNVADAHEHPHDHQDLLLPVHYIEFAEAQRTPDQFHLHCRLHFLGVALHKCKVIEIRVVEPNTWIVDIVFFNSHPDYYEEMGNYYDEYNWIYDLPNPCIVFIDSHD